MNKEPRRLDAPPKRANGKAISAASIGGRSGTRQPTWDGNSTEMSRACDRWLREHIPGCRTESFRFGGG